MTLQNAERKYNTPNDIKKSGTTLQNTQQQLKFAEGNYKISNTNTKLRQPV